MRPTLVVALEAGIEVEQVRNLIRRFGFRPVGVKSEHWPWPVKIYTLGEFRILRDDQAVQFAHKAPRRVLAVLKYIIAHGGEGIPLHGLADALWSDEEGDAALHALGVSLARLRKLLGSSDALIVNDERVSINLDLIWTDTWMFEDLVQQIDSDSGSARDAASTEGVRRLLAVYRGDFLPSDRDAPWALRSRVRLRARFIRCLTVLGAHLEARGRWELALDCYRRGLETDDVAEEFYQGLMRCYEALAQPAQGIAVFERLRQTLSTALGVVPSPASERLAHKLQSLRSANR